MKKYLLDTNICVFFLRGQRGLHLHIQEKGWENCFISEVTVLELRYGAENSPEREKSHNAVTDFVDGISVIKISGTANRYAQEKVRLRRAGTPVHDEFDLLIGVTAVEHNLILITDNGKDFKRIRNLEIENWARS